MLKRIKDLIYSPQGLEDAVTPQKKKADFVVTYKGRLIGTLELDSGKWKFTYSDEFKIAHFIAPLFDFPDVSKSYTSEDLWPFFAGRIPGLKQPDVEQVLEKEKIDKTDIVALLARFGRRTITNPFVVEQRRLAIN